VTPLNLLLDFSGWRFPLSRSPTSTLAPATLLMIFLLGVAQPIIGAPVSGIVVSEKMEPIPFVNIGIPAKGVGTVAAEDGTFALSIPDELLDDTICFSSIGFLPVGRAARELLAIGVAKVVLKERVTELQGVVVRGTRDKKLTLGSKTKARFLMSSLGTGDLGGEVGTLIHIKRKRVILDSLHFFLIRNTFDTVKLRLNLYAVEGPFPKPSLTVRNIIITVTGKKQGLISESIAHARLELSDNFIATLELVTYSNKRKGVLIFSQAPPYTAPMYYRNKSLDKVKRFMGGPMGIYFSAYEVKS